MPQHPITPLNIAGKPAQLLLTPCPGTKDAPLTEALQQLRDAGAKIVLTMMQAEELQRFGVDDMANQCAQLGLRWLHLPIGDDAAPAQAFQLAWAQHKEAVLQLLDQQGGIVVHCKGGTGRTGLVAALLLLEAGLAHDDAVVAVQSVREKALRNPEQAAYVRGYAHALLGRR